MTMFDLTGRTAMVTGAARGLGLATAQRLAGAGARVVMADISVAVRDSASKLESDGLNVMSLMLDVTDPDAVSNAFDDLISRSHAPDILVCNAGITDNIASVTGMKYAAWKREIDTNLTGSFLCIQAALPSMVERRWGRIISISSLAGLLGLHGAVGYSATKAGLLGLTRTVALEHFRNGITSNSVCPGPIRTGREGSNPNLGNMLRSIPGERLAELDEVTAAVHFLASDDARFVNGIELPVDAGARLFYTSRGRSDEAVTHDPALRPSTQASSSAAQLPPSVRREEVT